MDGHDLGAWSALACLLLVLLLVQFAFARRLLAALGEWIRLELTTTPPPDQEALDLYQALRRERLVGHVARLRRILADDSHQSAVRQIGNRIAYGQLLAELAEVADAVRTVTLAPERDQPRIPDQPRITDQLRLPGAVVVGAGQAGSRYAPRVEILDLGGWRRR